jgi:hypothetical protein
LTAREAIEPREDNTMKTNERRRDAALTSKRGSVEPRAVRSVINYSVPIRGRLHIDVRDFSRTNMRFEPHTVLVRDARDVQDRLSLGREGFVLADHRSAVARSRDLELLGRDYHAEMQEMLKDLTSARDVLPQRTGLLIRFGERAKETGSAKPARFAHLDYTTEWAHRFVDLVTGWERASLEPYRRFAIYQTWRATSEPPQDNTLAICDGRTVANEDTVEFDVAIGPEEIPGNTFVSRVVRYSAAHEWYYFSNLTRDEVIVFKAFDSDEPDALNAAHTAFDDPTAPPNAVPRVSIEARFVAFFD